MALASVSEVKQHLYGTTSPATFDTLIGSLIDHVEARIKKEFGIVTVDADSYEAVTDEIIDATGRTRFYPKLRPVRAVSAVATRSADWGFTAYTGQTLSEFEVDDYIVYTQFVILGCVSRGLKISYTCGYKDAEVPDDLKLAVILLVAHLFNQRENVGLKAQSILGVSITMDDKESLIVDRILKKYKRIHAY